MADRNGKFIEILEMQRNEHSLSSKILLSFLLVDNFLWWFFWVGCKYYKRRCKIQATCCNKIYLWCHCCNEATVCIYYFYILHDICSHNHINSWFFNLFPRHTFCSCDSLDLGVG
ncbi:hypothetical protein I3760_02G068100 [Carya illinoinensis]|nr:hypothetical protein I3760_02G068100 [Carya illinoinensis]